jgi:hypothetical protein
MNKIRTNIKDSNFTSQFLGINCTCLNISTRLITFLLMFTAIANKSAVAGDKVFSEDQQSKFSASVNLPELDPNADVDSQVNTNLKQRSLVNQESHLLGQAQTVSINDGFTANVVPESFSNSFTDDQFVFASPDVSKTDGNLSQDVLVPSGKEHTQQQQSHIIAQVDSSGTVGDTFGDTNKLRQELLIEPIVIPSEPPAASPGSSAGTPSAYGASFGQAYVGGGLFFPLEENRDRVDGAFGFGFGLGNAAKSVGLEVNVNITSVGGGDSFDFGDSGSVGFKLHKYFSDGTAVAVGWSNPVKWGDVNRARDTIYGVVTKAFPLQPNNPNNRMPLTISVGVGSGAFRSKGAIEANDNAANLFASVGLRVLPQVSLVSSWTGNRLNMGASFVPFKKTPIVVNAIFTDITSNLNTGLGFSLTAGYTFRF